MNEAANPKHPICMKKKETKNMQTALSGSKIKSYIISRCHRTMWLKPVKKKQKKKKKGHIVSSRAYYVPSHYSIRERKKKKSQ